MSDKSKEAQENAEQLLENISKIEALTQRLVHALTDKKPTNPSLQGPSPELVQKASSAYLAEMVANPAKMIEQQAGFWAQSLKIWSEAQQALLTGNGAAPESKGPRDRRFKNPLWETHPFFAQVKNQYLLTSQALESALGDLGTLEPEEQRRVSFFARQVLDMFSPTNFLPTNPDALEKAVATNGQSLVDGLENLVRDIEAGDGELAVTLSDSSAFEVGGNIATTPGAVVYQNRMFQLLQYTPTTEKVYETPLILFPPWINKYYILDLRETNSLIKYAVEKGFTVFVVSWVNPDASYRNVGIDTYLSEGLLTAIDQVKIITGQEKVNAIGYCIAGTLLTIGLAYMAKTGDDSVNAATYFTTMTDFEDPGDLGVFIEKNFLSGIESEVEEKGYLDSFFMSRTFSYLRANDLVYGPALRAYMMGEAPPAFDLLHWNSDSTNLPARMAVEYLYSLYRDNDLAQGRFKVLEQTLDMADIEVPVYVVATKSDHIAPWKPSFTGLNKLSGKKTFILAQSGHIAGIVNPPSSNKYGHWTNKDAPDNLDTWLENAEFTDGSWWDGWAKWLRKRSGASVKARKPGTKSHPVLEAAPGSYVKVQAKDQATPAPEPQ